MNMKKALVMGAGGFIGSHMVKRLKVEGYWVRGVDLKKPEFLDTEADDFVVGDLRDPHLVSLVVDDNIDELYQFAADMGGAGYIFTGEHDADVMHNSGLINLNVVYESVKKGVKKVFYSSSACMYPEYNQLDPDNPNCEESSAYPANPDSEYGGKEKAPAAMCRKAILSNGEMEVWGDGTQTRSFLYIDECIEAVRRLMKSNFTEPVNIGSEEMIAINDFAQMAIDISKKNIKIKNIEGPLGVKGRNSDNRLFKEKIGWEPTQPLREGMEKTYNWIKKMIGDE